MRAMIFRRMVADDLDAVMAVQLEAYDAGFIEGRDVLAQRLAAAPETAWVASDAVGVCGYLVAYPSQRGKVTALGRGFSVATAPDCLYLHDLAVSARASGRGVGPELVRLAHAFALSAQLAWSALVSVQDSRAFWKRLGYVEDPPSADELAKLDAYPGDARYMARTAVCG
ncbi:GNAT family N-acetyltransferase [Azoarcus sp. L1K30]|uniref:GNAT family N-acetyltransferase n=1 Tax=Azoarcus sp. L1K30 TaxID=2820277 RepID=UPI001B8103CE|nr:GNAT family N-acetyltransferase [Azoarcus sp. L1K30]MBR0565035.1 GNAT family N-acetyltransferase [Azoarcus sp. L1K30]